MKKQKSTAAATLNKENILKILKESKKPVNLKEIEKKLRINRSERKTTRTLIREMLQEGAVILLKNGMYGIPREMNLSTGTLWCTRSGNGFLVSDKEGEKDIFIPSGSIKNAFHGDRVIARVEHTRRGKKEGKIIKVIERKTKNITGYVKKFKTTWHLVSEDGKIPNHFIIENTNHKQIYEGSLAAGRITRYPEDGQDPTCKIVKVFKGLNDVKSIVQFVTFKHNLPQRFKTSTGSEMKGMDISNDTLRSRLDLTGLRHITIDGEYAKDFDDAVFVEKTRNGYVLYVSIADVSYYVQPGTTLDSEAYERGTSVYFPGTVIPMLPKILSNVVCSLNPNEVRLAVTAKIEYSKDATTIRASFHESVIKSVMRLTYNKVEMALVHRDKKAIKELELVMPDLELMRELAELIANKRDRRGSLDFDLPEPEVLLDIEGGIKGIVRSERLFSHRLIEEFMIAANEEVAGYLFNNKIPALYRVHERPDHEKLADFERLLHNLPLKHKKIDASVGYLQSILKSASGTQYEFLINKTLLKSMKQARYSPSNKGHFGLASECYLHFTSPIRRYPDLVCHRALKLAISSSTEGEGKKHIMIQELESAAVHLSERERIAMEAERELEDRIKVFYMKDRIGEIYEGVISHITSFGIFVELSDIFVEGIVLLSGLHDDYYIFQEDKFRLIGRRTKKIYRIGDRVKINVALADVELNRLHFSLVRDDR